MGGKGGVEGKEREKRGIRMVFGGGGLDWGDFGWFVGLEFGDEKGVILVVVVWS